jgi:hypothetical protein
MKLRFSLLILALCGAGCATGNSAEFADTAGPVKNVKVFFEEDRFAGWPANNGIWNWGDEIVVGFTLGTHKDTTGHTIDRDKPEYPMQARSLDGGETWTIERPSYLTDDLEHPEYTDCPGGIDFTQPNFAMMFRMEHSNHGYSFFYWSNDRCKTWNGPYRLPTFGRSGIFARTDYIVEGKHDMMAFMTAAEDEGGEGWPFAVRTTDGGKTWDFLSWIGPHPDPAGYSIMPSTVRLSDTSLLSIIRRKGINDQGNKWWWIESFQSDDNAKSWYLRDEPTIDNDGNPCHMIRLNDGRIAMTYGYRRPPHGIHARISNDNGKTFGETIVLRDDGDKWDVGYPRTVQRADGKIVTCYYFNDVQQKERYIGATIWDPGNAE